MERILNTDAVKHVGEKIKVAGWLDTIRSHGGIVFLDLRDRSAVLQVVCSPALTKDLKQEDVLEIDGEVKKRPPQMVNPHLATGQVELKAEKISVLAKADVLPFDLKDLKLSLPTLLDWRPLTLRSPKIKAIFKIQESIIDSFRRTLKDLDFFEFQAPLIVPTNAEGGAEVFHIDYYKSDAYLAQSPQLYKQIMVGGFERVFTVTQIFRAEPSVTTRHLSEYTSLDAEMAFIKSWEELMEVVEVVIKNTANDLAKNCQAELKMHDAASPTVPDRIPQIKMREAQTIVFERTGRDHRKEPDLDPDDEKEICQFAKEKYGSDFVFITHYPTKKRPFYTYADPADPDYTLSFDLLCRGLEIVTGGQRINDYETLVKNLKQWGNDVKDFQFYLQAFKYGLPPEGGFAVGAERLVKQILGLENIREASLFPRDMIRVDQRFSSFKEKPRAKKSPVRRKKKK